MDSRDVTSLRTAAATAVAARYLARPASQTVTICGCGEQGRHQVRALAHVFHLRRVFAFDTSTERARRFADEFSSQLHLAITPVNELRPAIAQSDICVTCTPSQQSFLGPDDVAEGTFVAAVGADNPHKSEIHPALMTQGQNCMRCAGTVRRDGRPASRARLGCDEPLRCLRRTRLYCRREKARKKVRERNYDLRQHWNGVAGCGGSRCCIREGCSAKCRVRG